MRNWLGAKQEEDKRKQEEEKTRQETLRLEQRKIEQSMLRESLQGGIPPHMVPIVFAGMGGANLANASLEWAQHYLQQMSLQQQPSQPPQIQYQPPQQQAQQPQQVQQALPPPQGSPDIRRDRAGGPGANPYAQHPPPNLPAPPAASQSAFSYDRARQQQAIQAAPPATSAPRPGQSALARLTTGEMQIQPPPPGGSQLPLQPQPPQIQSSQDQQPPPQQGPPPPPSQQQGQSQNTPTNIYFHHWIPPNASKEPPTPSNRSTHGSPYAPNATSHLRSEYANSPKKRKTNAGEAASGVSTSRGPTSPALSQVSTTGRRRAQSNLASHNSSESSLRGATEPGTLHTDDGHQRRPSTSEPESGSGHRGSGSGASVHNSEAARLSRHSSPGQGTSPKREADGPP